MPGKATNVSFCPSWFEPVRNINICLIIKFSGFIPCPPRPQLAPTVSHLSSRHLSREERWHQLPHLQLMIGGRLFQVPVCLSSLHPTGEVVIWRRLVLGVCKGLVTVQLYGNNSFLIKYRLIFAEQFQWWHLSLKLLVVFSCSCVYFDLQMCIFRCKAPYKTSLWKLTYSQAAYSPQAVPPVLDQFWKCQSNSSTSSDLQIKTCWCHPLQAKKGKSTIILSPAPPAGNEC